MSYLPGTLPADSGPLARFLPPLEEGVVARWLEENLAPGGRENLSTAKNLSSPTWLLDPFGSAPRLALEAARVGYRILVTVSHPLLFFLYHTLADPPAESDFSAALAELAAARKGDERLELHLSRLYRTTCPSCKRTISAESYLWRKGEKAPAAIRYACPHCGQRGEQPPAPSDLELLASLQATDGLHRARALERVVPLNDPQRPLVEEALAHYLPRPLYVLSTLTNRLQSLNLPPRRRQALIALIISLCDLGNDLWAPSGERPRPRQLSTPPQFREHNLWQEMENAISQWVSHAAAVPVTIWPELPPSEGGLCLFRGRVRDFARQEGPKPPFQAAIAALPRPNQAFWTLSALWAGWIWGAEAVAPLKLLLERRRYDWAWNMEALRAALGHVFRLLPAEARFFALLAEPETAALTAALCAAQSASFKLRELALRTPHDAVQITWERAAAPLAAHPAERVRLQDVLQDFLRRRGEPAPYFHLQAAALCALEKENALVIVPSRETEPTLKAIHRHIQKAIQDTCQHWSAHESLESGLWGLNTPPEADSLADRVERLLVQFLQKHPQVTFLEVEDALYPQFDGLQTPSRGLLYAVLTSYAERREGLWHLRPEDTASARRAALKEMAHHLERLGERLRYVNRWVDASTLLWVEEERVEVLIRLQASAQCGWLATAPAAPRRLLVIPGGRVGLLMYKSGRDPRLATLLSTWNILKFRRLRLMQELPLLTRETFEEQVRLDPPEHTLQMMLF